MNAESFHFISGYFTEKWIIEYSQAFIKPFFDFGFVEITTAASKQSISADPDCQMILLLPTSVRLKVCFSEALKTFMITFISRLEKAFRKQYFRASYRKLVRTFIIFFL